MVRNVANLRRKDNFERAYAMLGCYHIFFGFCSTVRYTKSITRLYMPDIFQLLAVLTDMIILRKKLLCPQKYVVSEIVP